MNAMTTLGCNFMINFVFGNGEGLKTPEKLYLALFVNNPETSDPLEVSQEGTGYERQEVQFNVSQSGNTSNINTITFPVAKKKWGVITSIGVFADLKQEEGSEPELIFYTSIPNKKSVDTNSVLSFAPGNINFKLI